MTVVHNIAKEGFGTGTNELYDRYVLLTIWLCRLRVSATSLNCCFQRAAVVSTGCSRARPPGRQGLRALERSRVRTEAAERQLAGQSADAPLPRIGAGTGISTRALLAHPDWANSINELRAIEPSEGMRLQFSKNTKDPRVSVREGTFDTTNIEDGWADVIIIAQVRALHHVSPRCPS